MQASVAYSLDFLRLAFNNHLWKVAIRLGGGQSHDHIGCTDERVPAPNPIVILSVVHVHQEPRPKEL